MNKKPNVTSDNIELTAFWGNGDAESTIEIDKDEWEDILAGAKYKTSGTSWYEGRSYSVKWSVAKGMVSILGRNGMECLIDFPVEDLTITSG